jgi:DNA-binding PucR family transcriptional regulator
MDLSVLLRAYRLGHAMVEERFETVAAELDIPREIRWRVLAEASRYLFAYVDAVCTRLVQDYEQERARWIRGAAAARAELVTAIIDGQPIDPRTATATLRYDVSRQHLAFIVWADARTEGPLQRTGSLEVAANALAGRLGGGPVLLVPIGGRAVWAWTSGAALGDDEDLTRETLGDGLRAAIGTSATGVAGMAESHDRARAARRVGELLAVRPGTIVRYGSVALTALLTADPAEAVKFAESQLGELGADTDNAARLRATLRVYLDENLSPARAARRLGIHQNTVVYRVRKAEEILGRTIDQRRLELEVSLRLSESLDGLRSAGERRKPR